MTAATHSLEPARIAARIGRIPEPAHRRTFAPVHRYSHLAGGEKWRPFSWKQGRMILLAAEMKAEKLRQPGQRTGARGTISFGALKLLKVMIQIAVRGRGRLEPSIEWLARALNVPLKSIHAWKAQLKAHGFLDWRRRYVLTGRQGIRGPQVEQTSNAYWLKAPAEDLKRAQKVVAPKGPQESPAEMAERMRRMADDADVQRKARLDAALDRLGKAVAAREAEGEPPRPPGRT